jgi:phosphatidylserine/phosphatidylglycerophosphate/cardiolipin synthase-like enzyme
LLVDGENYYTRLEQVLRRAERSILIVGWDFDAGIKLRPNDPDCPPIGDFLRSLVDQRSQLKVRVLVWSVAVIHAPGSPLPLLLGAPWEDHPRIQVRLDREHPLYAAHHQKIVCVDDAVAFAGGIDLTIRRWDTRDHVASHQVRKSPDGVPYPPVHDAQMVVEGETARVVSEVARERWRRAIGEHIPPVTPTENLWPQDLQPHFVDTPVAVVRTFASWNRAPEITEGYALTIDALSAARRSIYIEAQYLTAPRVRKLLAKSLRRPDGPEIVIIVRRLFTGKMEAFVMGGNQKRLVQHLRRADRHRRLGAYYPVIPQETGDRPVTVHSKIVIIDDDFVRVGSSNLNNRSIALDTECDLAVEVSDDARRRTIAGLREGLIAEHLDTTPEAVRDAVAMEGSLIRAIERLGCNRRCLRPIPDMGKLPTRPVFGTWLLDPPRPFFLFQRKRAKHAAA